MYKQTSNKIRLAEVDYKYPASMSELHLVLLVSTDGHLFRYEWQHAYQTANRRIFTIFYRFFHFQIIFCVVAERERSGQSFYGNV